MIKRSLERPIRAALTDTPVTMVVGARQTGKSTLVVAMAGGDEVSYTSLDDPTALDTARSDPVAFVEDLDGVVNIIDEVQRAPEVFLPIKAAVDRDRRPGRFLLTGSANPLFIPQVAEALAGRIEILTLWPLSGAELEGRPESKIAKLLLDPDGPPKRLYPVDRKDLASRIVRGGFPEAIDREPERRSSWFGNYLTTILERDVRAIGDISRLEQLPRLLTAIALRSRGSLNKSGLSRELEIPMSSMDRYLLLLERIYLVRRLPAWHNRLGPRLVKAPKLLICDSGLLCHLLLLDEARLLSDPTSFGLALEGFVGIELAKAADLDFHFPRLMHYRTSKGTEIDFVLEAGDGRVAAIEVKASSTLEAADFRRFDRLRESLGPRFVRGVIFYTGDTVLPFGDRLQAWPVSVLWGAT